MKNFTHTGKLIGCDTRTDGIKGQTIKLRRTKYFWVSDSKVKYSILDGYPTGSDYPMWKLDLLTINPIA